MVIAPEICFPDVPKEVPVPVTSNENPENSNIINTI